MSIKSVFSTSFRLSCVLQIVAVTLNHVDEDFSVAGQVRIYLARFTGGKESIRSVPVRSVRTRSAKKKIIIIIKKTYST